MNILGINAFGHDPAASLVADGKIIAAAEEERFNRIKHSDGLFPLNAIRYCLSAGGLKIRDIDYVVLNNKPSLYLTPKYIWTAIRNIPKNEQPLSSWILDPVVAYNNESKIKKHLLKHFGHAPKIKRIEHHIAHASSAFRCSGFERANILTMDACGEYTSTLLAVGNGNKIEKIKEIHVPNSLGRFYGVITETLGFRRFNDEEKVMGLACFGKPEVNLSDVIKIGRGSYKTRLGNIKFNLKKGEITELHKNLAASAQKSLERAAIALKDYLYDITGYKKLCLAGGVALNCDMNSAVLQSGNVEDIFIHPAANDPGLAIGAPLEFLGAKTKFAGSYFGPEYTNERIKAYLDECKMDYEYVEDIENFVGEEILPKSYITGWFQGKTEWGPRALGNRSIVANPGNPKMRDMINYCVKHREEWRPFAPSTISEDCGDYYEDYHYSPYMLLTFKVKKEKLKEIISASHVDETSRVQEVSRKSNERYYKMISAFKKETGTGTVLNTSFNDAGEPIVCSPKDAIRTFNSTGMDCLAVGNYFIRKPKTKGKVGR